MTRQPGTRCTLRASTWDGPPPEPGDFLRTKAGTCYQINEWRPSRPGSKTAGVLHVTRLEHDAVTADQPGVHPWTFYARLRRS
jgi:hypothetical protein